MLCDKIHFPDLSPEFRRTKFAVPAGKVRAVLDTDTFNEIDDQFAVAAAMLAEDRFDMRAITAAPFFNAKSTGPGDGMEKSYEELLRLMKLLRKPADNFIFRGSESYLPDRNTPVDSPAARRIVELAHEAYAEGENLWVMAIGAITNVASALLLDPEIIRMVAIVWLAGHPPYWCDNEEFNIHQDIPASQVIFESGVPLIQIPANTVAELLLVGPEELRVRCLPTGPLGEFLSNRVFDEIASYNGYCRSIWDISAPGYFLVPEAFMCDIVPAPKLQDGSARYLAVPGQHEMKIVRHISRDPVFDRFFELMKHSSR